MADETTPPTMSAQTTLVRADQTAHGGGMKIGDAINIFEAHGRELEGLYEEVYSKLIAGRERVILSNSNYLHALQITTLMLRQAKHRFLMVTGCTGDFFIATLAEEFEAMLKRFRELHQRAYVVVINAPAQTAQLTDLLARFPGTFNLARGVSDTPEAISHYIVADDAVRREKPHKDLNIGMPADIVQAEVTFNSKSMADVYESTAADLFSSLAGGRVTHG